MRIFIHTPTGVAPKPHGPLPNNTTGTFVTHIDKESGRQTHVHYRYTDGRIVVTHMVVVELDNFFEGIVIRRRARRFLPELMDKESWEVALANLNELFERDAADHGGS